MRKRERIGLGSKRQGEIFGRGRVRRRRRGSGERERAARERGEESGCDPHPEMLCWLREDEMSVQELLQRVQCVITHVGKSPEFSSFFSTLAHI